ncbi:hypothetical protein NO135_25735, partial [Clostridioides difficile]|nr:hypothetical protein [Clostridioides difficile]
MGVVMRFHGREKQRRRPAAWGRRLRGVTEIGAGVDGSAVSRCAPGGSRPGPDRAGGGSSCGGR